MTLFQTPQLDLEDSLVLDEIHRVRDELSDTLRTPRRWTGKLRRHNEARAIRGSNALTASRGTTLTSMTRLRPSKTNGPYRPTKRRLLRSWVTALPSATSWRPRTTPLRPSTIPPCAPCTT